MVTGIDFNDMLKDYKGREALIDSVRGSRYSIPSLLNVQGGSSGNLFNSLSRLDTLFGSSASSGGSYYADKYNYFGQNNNYSSNLPLYSLGGLPSSSTGFTNNLDNFVSSVFGLLSGKYSLTDLLGPDIFKPPVDPTDNTAPPIDGDYPPPPTDTTPPGDTTPPTDTTPPPTTNNATPYISKGTFDNQFVNKVQNEIKTNKFSGGSLEIADMLADIGEAVKASGQNAPADKIQILAGHAKNIGLIQQELEKYVDSLNGEAPADSHVINKPSGYNTNITSFPSNNTFGNLYGVGTLGGAQVQTTADNSDAYLYIKIYKELMNDTQVSASVKNLLKQATFMLGTIGETADDIFWVTRHPEFANQNNVDGNRRDPLTGNKFWPVMDLTDITPFEFYRNYSGEDVTLP